MTHTIANTNKQTYELRLLLCTRVIVVDYLKCNNAHRRRTKVIVRTKVYEWNEGGIKKYTHAGVHNSRQYIYIYAYSFRNTKKYNIQCEWFRVRCASRSVVWLRLRGVDWARVVGFHSHGIPPPSPFQRSYNITIL